MKKLLILAAFLTVGAGAFAQAKAGSLGVKAGIAGSSTSVGLDYYLQPGLSLEVAGFTTLNSTTTDAVQKIPSTSEYTTADTNFGFSGDLFFRVPVGEGLDVGFGPGGYWQAFQRVETYAALKSRTVGNQTVNYGSYQLDRTSYGATLGVQLKYFLGPRVSVYTKVGGGFGTYGNKLQYLNTSGESLAEVDSSFYEFYTTTPALGVVFYLN